MVIKNLTNSQIGVRVKELTGDNKEYDIYIAPLGESDIDRVALVSPEKYIGLVEVNGMSLAVIPVKLPTPEPEKQGADENSEDTVVDTTEVTPSVDETTEVTPSIDETTDSESFICEHCGAEFASARGLSAHKNKAHSDLSK